MSLVPGSLVPEPTLSATVLIWLNQQHWVGYSMPVAADSLISSGSSQAKAMGLISDSNSLHLNPYQMSCKHLTEPGPWLPRRPGGRVGMDQYQSASSTGNTVLSAIGQHSLLPVIKIPAETNWASLHLQMFNLSLTGFKHTECWLPHPRFVKGSNSALSISSAG